MSRFLRVGEPFTEDMWMGSYVVDGYQGHINCLNNFSLTRETRIQFWQGWDAKGRTRKWVLCVSLEKKRKLETALKSPSLEATFVCTALCLLADMVCLSLASQLLNATIIKNKSIKIYN